MGHSLVTDALTAIGLFAGLYVIVAGAFLL